MDAVDIQAVESKLSDVTVTAIPMQQKSTLSGTFSKDKDPGQSKYAQLLNVIEELGRENMIVAIVQFCRLWLDYLIDFIFSLKYRDARKQLPPAENPLVLLSLTQMQQKIRNRSIKSEELVRAHVERIKEVNGIVNAVVDDRFESAIEEAKLIDQGIENGTITEADFEAKPLLGIPFTSKETTHCKGMKISFGLIPRKDIVAEEDADIIKNVKASGAILLGVTNIPQLNLWYESHNPVYGVTNNPYNTTRNCGGSSGGEASIVASCGSPFGVGTDIGGSVRIPASMCGLFGHKITNRLTPTKGLTYRTGEEAETTMVSSGPLVRYAEDIIPGIKAILGPSHKTLNLDQEVNIKELKYYYIIKNADLRCSPTRPDVKATLQKVVDHFKTITDVTELEYDDFKYTVKLFNTWMHQEKGANFRFDITGRKEEASTWKEFVKYWLGKSDFTFAAIALLLNDSVMPKFPLDKTEEITNRLRKDILDKLGDNGVLIYQSAPMAASYHHAHYLRPFNMSPFAIFNLLKLPVTQVPMGLNEEGLPLGVQIVTAPNNDRLSIAVAKELQSTFGGYVPPFVTE